MKATENPGYRQVTPQEEQTLAVIERLREVKGEEFVKTLLTGIDIGTVCTPEEHA